MTGRSWRGEETSLRWSFKVTDILKLNSVTHARFQERFISVDKTIKHNEDGNQ